MGHYLSEMDPDHKERQIFTRLGGEDKLPAWLQKYDLSYWEKAQIAEGILAQRELMELKKAVATLTRDVR